MTLLERIPKPILIVLALLVSVILYWPSLNGLPIWDDLAFWFLEPSMAPDFHYADIWTKYNWPLSVSFQKWAFSLWGEKYQIYHLINLFVHMLNSFLVLKLAQKMKWPHPYFIFLLFLIYPANVISVAWMIQFKTLLCFLLAILSFFAFDKSLEDKKWLIPSYVLFGLSLISKSSSVTLPLIFCLYAFKTFRWKSILLCLPLFIMSGLATYRLVMSPVTQETVNIIQDTVIEEPAVALDEPIPTAPEDISIEVTPTEVPDVTELIVEDNVSENGIVKSKMTLVPKTLRYYFWETIYPYYNQPVKGAPSTEFRILDLVGIISILVAASLAYKIHFLWGLISGFILLLPYLGIIYPPYMNITWVSDQHLYLALPLFIAFFVLAIGKLPKQVSHILMGILTLFFVYKTYEATAFYKDEVAFYEASLTYDPTNVPIAHNLAESFYSQGMNDEALNVINNLFEESKTSSAMELSPYWPDILELKDEIEREKN